MITAGLAIAAGESPNALVNLAKGAQQGFKGFQERLQTIQTNKEKLDEDFARLYEIRQDKTTAAGDKLRELKREETRLEATAKRRYSDILSSLANKKVEVQMADLQRAAAASNASLNAQTPDRQTFNALLEKHGGDIVAARKAYNALTGDKSDAASLGLKAGLEALYRKKADVVSSAMPAEMIDKQAAAIDAEIAKLTGVGRSSSGTPTTKAQYDALPKGATYVAPDGTTRVKG